MRILFFSLLAISFITISCKEDSKTSTNSISKVELGKMLYFDERLSKDDTISCNTCHDITNKKGGVDGLATSTGINAQKGGRNAPTVWNAKHLSVQFWDGRAKDLADQAKGPITNPIEMGMENHDTTIAKLKNIKGYVDAFNSVYGENSFNIDNLADAIAAFESTLVTTNSRFDKFKAGDKSALTDLEKKGYDDFQKIGCTSCHSGEHFAGPTMEVGNGFFMKFPTFDDPTLNKKYDFKADLGRYEVTKNDSDKHMWRIPTLRNIELTGPYFHNGSVTSLEEAVTVMAKMQLHKDLSADEKKQLVAFLKSLTGELPEIKTPDLPK